MKKNNYHTHTFRCGHGIGNEHEMIQSAIREGYQVLGFSEHVPLPHLRKTLLKSLPHTLKKPRSFLTAFYQMKTQGPNMRMPYEHRFDHQKKVATYRYKYQDKIKIYMGYEAEYLEDYLDYYQQLLDDKDVDYLILGNHFNKYLISNRYYGNPDVTVKDLYQYCDDVIKAIKSNLFSYIAHPDIFLLGYRKFDDVCKEITTEICKCAKEYNIPLEINAGGIRRGKHLMGDKEDYLYCNGSFFDIAGEIGNDIIIGMDAHSPLDFNKDYEVLLEFAKVHNLKLIDEFEFRKGK